MATFTDLNVMLAAELNQRNSTIRQVISSLSDRSSIVTDRRFDEMASVTVTAIQAEAKYYAYQSINNLAISNPEIRKFSIDVLRQLYLKDNRSVTSGIGTILSELMIASGEQLKTVFPRITVSIPSHDYFTIDTLSGVKAVPRAGSLDRYIRVVNTKLKCGQLADRGNSSAYSLQYQGSPVQVPAVVGDTPLIQSPSYVPRRVYLTADSANDVGILFNFLVSLRRLSNGSR